jgi:hypothetical protein
MDPDPGGPKTCGPCGSGSPTLLSTNLWLGLAQSGLDLRFQHAELPEKLNAAQKYNKSFNGSFIHYQLKYLRAYDKEETSQN